MSVPAVAIKSSVYVTAAEPQLFVTDIRASCDFFAKKLGFAVVFAYGEPPFYAQVKRDGARLNLRCVDTPVIDGARRVREQLLSTAITVRSAREIDELYAEFETAGVTFHQSPQRQAWGAITFVVEDPDGNLLLFAAPADE